MSLFPAYGQAPTGQELSLKLHDVDMQCDSNEGSQDVELSPGAECLLLAEPPPSPPRAVAAPAPPPADFYLDRKLDRGNLRVSTLYYPARPEYRARDAAALGVHARAVRAVRGGDVRAPRAKRYWRRAAAAAAGAGCGGGADAGVAAELAQRGAAFRQALDANPADEELWLRYIDFLEWSVPGEDSKGSEGAVEAARAGVAHNPRSACLRARLHAALRRALAPADLAACLQHMTPAERSACGRAELFAREVSALACAGALADARAVAAAAVRDRALAIHMHLVLLVYGCVLRSAGLWEQLVQLVELVVAMNFPQSSGFPPAERAATERAAEAQLAAWEARALRCGLPGGAVWARVERARAALHWRAPIAPAPLELAADPQRAPPPAALADLLAPAAGERAAFRLLVTLLRLAETPLLPACGYVARAAAGGAGLAEPAADWEAGGGASLLALLRAARRLPPAHPARAALCPRAARRLLALTPLRSATVSSTDDDTGFGSWARALWDAALHSAGGAGGAGGAGRVALLCWRLRVLHARALIAVSDEERRAVRSEAREALRRWAGDAALPYVVFARVEAACDVAGDVASEGASPVAGGVARGVRAALQAARQALRVAADENATSSDVHTALYAARVVHELSDKSSPLPVWVCVCAASRRALPTGEHLLHPPTHELVQRARDECLRQCLSLEAQYSAAEEQQSGNEDDDSVEDLLAAMLPGAAEWGCARALLHARTAHDQLLGELQRTSGWRLPAGLRYREQVACALVSAATRASRAAAARYLAPLFPLNMYLALVSSGTPVWQASAHTSGSGSGDRSLSLSHPRGECATWAALLPALLRAAGAGWTPQESHAVYRLCSRAIQSGAAGCAGGALLHALRCETAPDPRAPLTHALAHVAHCKWLLVRGAALGGDVAQLSELALERGLRLHALPQELQPLEPLEPLEALEPLEPLESLQPLEPLQALQPLEPLQALQPLEPLEPLEALQPLSADTHDGETQA